VKLFRRAEKISGRAVHNDVDLPNRSTVAEIAFSTSSGLRTSAAMAKASPMLASPSPPDGRASAPSARVVNRFRGRFEMFEAAMTSATFAPASASARATPPVMPVPRR